MGVLALLAVGLGTGSEARANNEVIKIGTLAPAASPWGQVFSVWAKAVSEKSGGALSLQFFFSGAQGDESAMVGKIKSGQLDGAALSAVGLSKVYKPILALQMPGLFASWEKLDAARNSLKGEFEKGAQDAGFQILGWGDVGAVRYLSKGVAVRSPDSFKGQKPMMWRDDTIQPIFFQTISGVTPVPLNIPEVLPNLNTGAINILSAPSLVAEQLQWASKLDTINNETVSLSVGALILSSKKIDSLPQDQKMILIDTGKVAAAALTKRIRNEDAAAFARIKGKMTVVTLSADEKSKFDAVYKQTRQKLSQGTFSADLVSKLEALAK